MPYSLMGLAALVGSFLISDMPDWGYWAPFAVLFVLLEFFAVEVNDRMLQSASVMVAMTAGVILAMLPDSDAMFGLALMGASPCSPRSTSRRSWFQPAANFGQFVVAAVLSGFILDTYLEGVPFNSTDSLLMVLVVSAVALRLRHRADSPGARRGEGRVRPGQSRALSQMPALFVGQVAMGLIGGLIGAFPLPTAKRSSFSSWGSTPSATCPLRLLQLRDSHIGSIRGFVKTLEAKDMYTRGHTERVAFFAQMIGEEMAFSGTQLETLRWSALIHDLGKLAVPTELIRKRGRLDEDEYAEMKAHAQLVEEILAEVDFLSHGRDRLRPSQQFRRQWLRRQRAQPGSAASDRGMHRRRRRRFRRMTSARSYRMALSQQYAISELRRNSGAQFHPEVVDAFEQALNKTGRRWGAPHVNDEEMARRLAEEPELTSVASWSPRALSIVSWLYVIVVAGGSLRRHTCGQRPDDAVGCSDGAGARLDGRVAASNSGTASP